MRYPISLLEGFGCRSLKLVSNNIQPSDDNRDNILDIFERQLSKGSCPEIIIPFEGSREPDAHAGTMKNFTLCQKFCISHDALTICLGAIESIGQDVV